MLKLLNIFFSSKQFEIYIPNTVFILDQEIIFFAAFLNT